MNIKNGILNVSKHGNKHDLIHFVTDFAIHVSLNQNYDIIIEFVISQNIMIFISRNSIFDIRILDEILISKMNLRHHKSNL